MPDGQRNINYNRGYDRGYRYNPYASRANQGSLLQFVQSDQPYIGRPINQMATAMEKTDSNNRALVDQANVVDMALSSIDVDQINQPIVDQERMNFKTGIDDISNGDSFLTASAKMNKLVSNFQRSQGVKTAISLKEQRTTHMAGLNESLKNKSITKGQYDDYMNKAVPMKAEQDAHGFYNDRYDAPKPAPVYDVAGLLTTVASRFRVNKNIQKPIHHFDPQTGELLYVELPSSEGILAKDYIDAFKQAFNANPGARDFLEDTMLAQYRVDGGGGVDAYIDDVISGFANSWAVNSDTTTFQAGTVANAVNAERQDHYAKGLKLYDNTLKQQNMALAHGYTMEELEAKGEIAEAKAQASNGINGNMVYEEVEVPREARSMNFEAGLLGAIDDVSSNLLNLDVKNSSLVDDFIDLFSAPFTTDVEDRSYFSNINNMYAYINDGEPVDLTRLNEQEYVDGVIASLNQMKNMLTDSGLYMTGYIPEHDKDQHHHAADMIFAGKTRLHPSNLGGNIENRKILYETEEGVKEITYKQFQELIDEQYKTQGDGDGEVETDIRKNGLEYQSAVLGADNPYVMLSNNLDFAYSRMITINDTDGEKMNFVVGDAMHGTELKHYAKIKGINYYMGSSNSNEFAKNVAKINTAMVNPDQGVDLPSANGSSSIQNYKTEYHANRGTGRKPHFSMELNDITPGTKGIVIVADTPSQLYLKYKGIRKRLRANSDANVAEVLAEFGEAQFFWDAAERSQN